MWLELIFAAIFVGAIAAVVAIVHHCKNTTLTSED